MKAIESYEAALQKDPNSFDAAYNRYIGLPIYFPSTLVLIARRS